MTNFIFKSANRLIKNSPITIDALHGKMNLILKEQRCQRQDLRDILRMLNKLLIDKHLQTQVDEYFTHGETPDEPPEDIGTQGE